MLISFVFDILYLFKSTQREDQLKQKTMNDDVFVMANSKLKKKKKQPRRPTELNLNDVSSDDDWLTENDDGDNEDLAVDNLELEYPNPNEDGDLFVEDQVGEDEHVVASAMPLDDLEIGGLENEGHGEDWDEDLLDDYDFNVQDFLL